MCNCLKICYYFFSNNSLFLWKRISIFLILAIPLLKSPPTMRSSRITEIIIKWPTWNSFVDPTLTLLYQVEYKLNDFHGNSTWKLGPLAKNVKDFFQQAPITGLMPNSFYEFRVIPIIKIGNQEVRGRVSPKSSTFRTKCYREFSSLFSCFHVI